MPVSLAAAELDDACEQDVLLRTEGEIQAPTPRKNKKLAIAVATAVLLAVVVVACGKVSKSNAQTSNWRSFLSLAQSNDLGVVDAVYTFGAPSASVPSFPNLQALDGCFPGLRIYTENKLPSGATEVDAASMFVAYPHIKAPVLALHEKNSFYEPCPSNGSASKWPKGGAAHWEMHKEKIYEPRLASLTLNGTRVDANLEPFATARKMRVLAWRSYEKVSQIKAALKRMLPGWTLVDRRVYEEAGLFYDDDPILVVQEQATLDCALVFTGTNNFIEFTASTTQHTKEYCGFPRVHAGYAKKVKKMTEISLWPEITAKLAQCRRVICVGHSLGGATCDVFSACANSHRIDDLDYQKLMWHKKNPVLMRELGSDNGEISAVAALYTYGSPAAGMLRNSKVSTGCFPGLRTYTEDVMPGGGKQEDAEGFASNLYPYALMTAASLQSKGKSMVQACNVQTSKAPGHGFFTYDKWGLHSEKIYLDRLSELALQKPTDSVVIAAKNFVPLAFGAKKGIKELKDDLQTHLPGWKIVAHQELVDKSEPALLAQDENSLECALVLPGDAANRGDFFQVDFCGERAVHKAYAQQLNKIAETMQWSVVRNMLKSCKQVTCVGQGKDGTLCTLFAACVNSQATDDQDFQRLKWTAETPKKLPEVMS